MKKIRLFPLPGFLFRHRILSLLVVLLAISGMMGCTPTKDDPDKPDPAPGSGNVPDELVGAWEHGYIDFALWENYPKGQYAGKSAIPSREAMIFSKNGEAKFYRYEFAFNMYEELIDCTGKVIFHGDGTFTFYPAKGRKRFYDTHTPSRNADRALTSAELNSPKLAGKRGYTYNGSSTPPSLRITVPSSAPYFWYKKF